MENEELNIKLKATLIDSINQFNQLTSSANRFDKTLSNLVIKTDATGQNIQKITRTVKSLDGTSSKIKEVMTGNGEVISRSFTKTEKSAKSLGESFKSLFNVNKIYAFMNATKWIRVALGNLVQSSVDYIETQNKFNMSMGNAKPEAVLFVNQITEAVGIAKDELMDYMSTYKNILSGLGNFTDKESEKISESLTKMALDYSSLFNVSTSSAMNKFQSALTGSIRPIRSDSGFDVSDTTIGAKAKELGLDRTVGQLNQMEKRVLRIIVLMDQMKNTGAFGDLARTIEQPANQLKILQNQLREVGVWLGNVFMKTIGDILPYVNGFVMALKEVIKLFALFVGYQADDSNLGDIFETVDETSGGIASNLGSASDSAKELKKTLMGFDVLNVITTPKEGSGGGGGVSSIDPAILRGLSQYDSLMENISMKATDIRDKIMDWLGFTKLIDPLTGEISWKLREGYQNIEKILDIVKAIGIGFASWKISKTFANIFRSLGWISKGAKAKIPLGISFAIAGFYLSYKGINHLLNDGYSTTALLETIGGIAGLGTGITTLLKVASGKLKFLEGRTLGLGIALTIGILGITMGSNAVKSGEFEEMLLSSILASAGGMFTLMSFGAGMPIVLGVGLGIALTTFFVEWGLAEAQAITEIKEKAKELKEQVEETITSYDNLIVGIQEGKEAKLLEMEATQALFESLEKVVDANGQIQEGMEGRVDFILGELNEALGTEYQRNGNIIQNYKDMQTEVQKLMEDLKQKIKLEAYEESYKESIKQQIKLQQEREKIIKEQNKLQEKGNELIENWYGWLNIPAQYEYNKAHDELTVALEENGVALEDTTEDMKLYEQELYKLQETTETTTDKNIESYEEVKKTIEKTYTEAGLDIEEFTRKSRENAGKAGTEWNAGFKEKTAIKAEDLLPSDSFSELGRNASNKFWSMFKNARLSYNTDPSKPFGNELQIIPYASGGLPDVGELFVAREAGPELVGKIGSSNAVMNNNQIVQAVSQGVAQAVSSVLGQGAGNPVIKVMVDGYELASATTNRQSRMENIYGTT